MATGFVKLKAILDKIDSLEVELTKELEDEEAKRKKNREDCQRKQHYQPPATRSQ